VQEHARQIQLSAAEVWDRAGWLRDVELPAAFPLIDRLPSEENHDG
jgi:hypothetical protein